MNPPASIARALRDATGRLIDAGHDSARLEAEVLLAHLLHISRARLYAQLGDGLAAEELAAYQALVQRHLTHEPVAYIVGKKEFYGLELRVDQRALIPRPETELLVEKAIDVARSWANRPLKIADVGTGSGALAISLAVALPDAQLYAIDSSQPALELAAINCRAHGVQDRVKILQGDLLGPLPEPVVIVVANLPYIPSASLAQLSPEIAHFEPIAALDGGEDGLQVYRRFLQQVPGKVLPGGCVIIEIAADQGQSIIKLVDSLLPNCRVTVEKDYGGLDRLATVEIGPAASG